ncbi:MAG: hypothetical protein Q9168_005914, partial [Polycauliona sp. 1 TL-2023]
MKTSRLARETIKIGNNNNLEVVTKRKTRSFAASINAFCAGDTPGLAVDQKQDESDDDSSSLSSLDASPGPFDIEDAPFALDATTPHKRKYRESVSPTTTFTKASSSIKLEPRTSPRKKAGISGSSLAKIKKGRKQPVQKVVDDESEEVLAPPANWEEVYSLVQEMRKKIIAPVDTMGCESLAEETRSPR